MKLTKQAIANHSQTISGLDGYSTVVDKIEKNKNDYPDIAIEACKSLIEGLAKKALELLSNEYNDKKKIRKNCDNHLPTLVRTAFLEVFTHSFELEIFQSLYELIPDESRVNRFRKNLKDNLLKKIENAVIKTSVIRDQRGDISHGRIYPKSDESDVNLSLAICSITDGICFYMINEMVRQYKYKLGQDSDGKLIYEQEHNYNNWLDDITDFPIKKINYSKVLFENDYDEYEARYDEYLSSLEEDKVEPDVKSETEDVEEKTSKTKDTEIKDDSKVTHKRSAEKPVVGKKEVLVNTFDKTEFWNEEKESSVLKFTQAENLNPDKLKRIINEYLFTKQRPLRDSVVEALNEKPKLSERKMVVEDLIDRMIDMIDKLKFGEEN